MQDPPFCIQVEPTEGCSLRCNFCGINGIRGKKRNFKYMSFATAERLAGEIQRLGWTSRIEFAMHGEPSLNPDLIGILERFRKELPKSYMMMESNGTMLHDDIMVSLFNCLRYLNCLGLDQYHNIAHVPTIREFMSKPENISELNVYLLQYTKKPLRIYEYPFMKDGNPHKRVTNVRRLTFISPIDTATSGTHSTLNNHCGSGAPKNDDGKGKRCAKPFRELSVRWDGSIAICCNDWHGTINMGNINEQPLDEIWNSELFQAARRRLVQGKRDFAPCLGCDATSHRVGLLPDKKGKETLPDTTDEDLALLNKTNGKFLTLPVLRDWGK